MLTQFLRLTLATLAGSHTHDFSDADHDASTHHGGHSAPIGGSESGHAAGISHEPHFGGSAPTVDEMLGHHHTGSDCPIDREIGTRMGYEILADIDRVIHPADSNHYQPSFAGSHPLLAAHDSVVSAVTGHLHAVQSAGGHPAASDGTVSGSGHPVAESDGSHHASHGVKFSGGCDCGFSPGTCGAAHYCRWQR